MLGDMMTLYIQEQLCETRRRLAHPPAMPTDSWPKEDILGLVPRLYRMSFILVTLDRAFD